MSREKSSARASDFAANRFSSAGSPSNRSSVSTHAVIVARAEDFSRETIGPQWLALIDELLGASPTTSA